MSGEGQHRARFLSASGRPLLEVRRLGRTRYEDAHRLQETLVERRIEERIGDQLLLTEHDPVITVGRAAERMPAELGGVPVVGVERGGDATYHGPGQLVAYPILRLDGARRDLHRYLRDLEAVVIGMLADVGVSGTQKSGLTGVWIGEKKVCSIGVAVRRWVAWHGFALNLSTDPGVFKSFRPCGLDPDLMTRLADHVVPAPDLQVIEDLAVKHFCAVFGHEVGPQAG